MMQEITMTIPFFDLKKQYSLYKEALESALPAFFDEQNFILGPKVKLMEERIASYSNSHFGCAVSSGTDALLAVLMAEEIGDRDEVITSPYTFFATAGSISRAGAKPVFVDIEPDTYNLNVSKLKSKMTSKTKAIMPVHLYGQISEMGSLMKLAKENSLLVIEDAAQAIGAKGPEGTAGSIGDYGCLSFFPTKNLGCFGDGGMVLAQSEERIEKIRKIRSHGQSGEYEHEVIGANFRMDSFQAIVLLEKLKHLQEWTKRRIENARLYFKMFESFGLGKDDRLKVPEVKEGNEHVFNQFVIRSNRRNKLQSFLKQKGIGTRIYYPMPLHLQPCFKSLGYKQGDFPESEKAALETLALPIYPELEAEDIKEVVRTIYDFFK